MNKKVYFKSFREGRRGPELASYDAVSGKYERSQTLGEVLETGVILPNTTHSKMSKRLSVSWGHSGFQGSYRPEGIIFSTEREPELYVPFDLMALTDGESFTSADYHSEFLKGHEKFLFGSSENIDLQYREGSRAAILALNVFRESHGLEPVEHDVMNYNEACFIGGEIPAEVIGLVGNSRGIREIGKARGLKVYGDFYDYFESVGGKV